MLSQTWSNLFSINSKQKSFIPLSRRAYWIIYKLVIFYPLYTGFAFFVTSGQFITQILLPVWQSGMKFHLQFLMRDNWHKVRTVPVAVVYESYRGQMFSI